MNNDIFLLEPQDMAFARDLLDFGSDIELGNRALANITAAKLAKKCLDEYSVDIDTGIHNVSQVARDIDISDIYIKGNFVNIRIYFNENELCVPKSHFDLGVLPEAYMFIKLDEDLSEGRVTGFLFPDDIDQTNEINGYYFVTEDSLKSFYDLDERLSSKDDEGYNSDFEKDVYSFLDGKLQDIKGFYKTLICSETARMYLINAAKAYFVFCSLEQAEETPSQKESDVNELEADDFLEADFEEESLTEEGSELHDLSEPETLDTYELNEVEDTSLELEEYYSDITSNTALEEVDSIALFNESDNENFELQEASEEDKSVVIDEFDTVTEPLNEEESVQEDNIPELTELHENLEEVIVDNLSESTEVSENLEEAPVENYELIDYVEEDADTDDTEPVETEDYAKLNELSEFDYSTEIMPSMNTIEEPEAESETATQELLPETDTEIYDNTVDDEAETEEGNSLESEANEQQIDELFTHENQEEVVKVKKRNPLLPLLGAVVVISAAGYLGYTKYFASSNNIGKVPEPITNIEKQNNLKKTDKKDTVAMPVETLEKTDVIKTDNQAVSVEIPAIEQNLNASIEVSNLAVNWEVPVGYANNTTAKRYFVKAGKILQINLKTELLLLSSPPITNRIAIELEYNKDTNRFGISKIINSSGVTNVDEVVKSTVNKVLGMNLNMNMSVFNNIQGNPILVIKL